MQDKPKGLQERKKMVKQKQQEKEENRFDFTIFELNKILKNANFNDRQMEVFNRLTDRKGKQTIVKMSMEMHLSTRTIDRIVKEVKNKIKKIL